MNYEISSSPVVDLTATKLEWEIPAVKIIKVIVCNQCLLTIRVNEWSAHEIEGKIKIHAKREPSHHLYLWDEVVS